MEVGDRTCPSCGTRYGWPDNSSPRVARRGRRRLASLTVGVFAAVGLFATCFFLVALFWVREESPDERACSEWEALDRRYNLYEELGTQVLHFEAMEIYVISRDASGVVRLAAEGLETGLGGALSDRRVTTVDTMTAACEAFRN